VAADKPRRPPAGCRPASTKRVTSRCSRLVPRRVPAVCDGGYSTNLPLADVTGGKAWVAVKYDSTASRVYLVRRTKQARRLVSWLA